MPDVAIVGGGIVGCAAAAFLAEAGARSSCSSATRLAGAAVGRNSGSVQHPFDPVLGALHAETLALYRELDGFELPDEPAGVLMLARERASWWRRPRRSAASCPSCGRRCWRAASCTGLEPLLAARPLAAAGSRPATRSARRPPRARSPGAPARAGALLHEGGRPGPGCSGRARGVIAGGEHCAAGAVLVAAGPWTPEVIDPTGAWRPIVPVWGVVVEVELERPRRATCSSRPAWRTCTAASRARCSASWRRDGAVLARLDVPRRGARPGDLGGAAARAPGRASCPRWRGAAVEGTRACARPQSFDGRPLVGQVLGIEGLWVAAGHGPWGISTGPATARLAADALLGGDEVPAALAAARFGAA